jgi:hypothetical protein
MAPKADYYPYPPAAYQRGGAISVAHR